MIKTFEKFTFELTDKEKNILPVLINGFKFYNKNNLLKNQILSENLMKEMVI